MTRHFNGAYSVRAGYHGARNKSGVTVGIDLWYCEKGHCNPSTELIDERATGGFVHRQRVTKCKVCQTERPIECAFGVKIGDPVQILVGGHSGEFGKVREIVPAHDGHPLSFTIYTDALTILPGYLAEQIEKAN